MSDDLVKQSLAELHDIVRCRCHPAYTGRGMHDPDCECDSIEAVKAVADRIEELEAKLAAKEKLVLALAGDKIDLVSELSGVKGKLAKAVKLAEEAFDFNDDGDDCLGWHSINDRIAELKRQDDE